MGEGSQTFYPSRVRYVVVAVLGVLVLAVSQLFLDLDGPTLAASLLIGVPLTFFGIAALFPKSSWLRVEEGGVTWKTVLVKEKSLSWSQIDRFVRKDGWIGIILTEAEREQNTGLNLRNIAVFQVDEGFGEKYGEQTDEIYELLTARLEVHRG